MYKSSSYKDLFFIPRAAATRNFENREKKNPNYICYTIKENFLKEFFFFLFNFILNLYLEESLD